MIKLKTILPEYIQNQELDLYHYYKNYKDNLFYYLTWMDIDMTLQLLDNGMDDEFISNLYEESKTEDLIDNGRIEEFRDYVYSDPEITKQVMRIVLSNTGHYNLDGDGMTLLCSEYRGIYKKDWILHFTDTKSAYDIQRNGFTHGTEDVEQLGLTTNTSKEYKQNGGFNFGYNINTYKRYYKSTRWSDFKYGDVCVMATTSGIRTYHYGDEEEQIIFWGKTASNFVIIDSATNYDVKGDWVVADKHTDRPIYSSNFESVVDWVVKNYNQYKNVL